MNLPFHLTDWFSGYFLSSVLLLLVLKLECLKAFRSHCWSWIGSPPTSQSRKRESFCVPFQHPHPLCRTWNHAVGVSQSEERLTTCIGSWASEENLFPFQMPSVQTYLWCTQVNLRERQCTLQLLPQPGAFCILFVFLPQCIADIVFCPMWGAGEY